MMGTVVMTEVLTGMRKHLKHQNSPWGGGKVYVEILAAGQQATVYVNGKEVTYHEGGYSTFRADITDVCHEKGTIFGHCMQQ